MEKSDNDIEQIKKIFEIGNYVLKNKIYLFLFILYFSGAISATKL